MRPYGHDGGFGHHGWFWIFPGITMILFWALLIVLIVLLWRAVTGRSRPRWAAKPGPQPPAPGAQNAEQVLADRLARGEIEVEDYHRRLAALRGTPPE
ncbi:putative membrane protein [Streptacidiphilus sp. MAP12-20]|uniref:SHOCT domain-containing protein n=1 Tax=Streptacidiphilus sp. MAP12-20 TaxID=3156299 RepID=UPI003519CF78